MKQSIFKNPLLQEEFDRNGFVKFKLFQPETIERLKEVMLDYCSEDPKSFFSSSYLEDFQIKKEGSDRITSLIENEAQEAFENFRLIGAAFLIKGSGEHSEMPMHQDWTIVDEQKFYAVNVWIPLTNTNEENGTLELLAGSHNWNKAIRAPTLPMSFQGFEDMIKPKLTIVDAEIGEVVVLNQATIHYSKRNRTSEIRPAITCGLMSKGAPLIFHYWDKERQQIERFSQDDDFLLRFENFHEAIYRRPTIGESTGFFDYEIPRFSEKEMKGLLGIQEAPAPRGFFQRLFARG